MSRLNEITDCGICKTIFQDPRVLPCIHTYCLRCLQSHGDSIGLRPGQKMSCPLCRDEFLIPENGLKGLQKNFFMSNLIEMRLIANPVDRNKVCEVCHDSGEKDVASQATMFCVECRQNLCDRCCTQHKRLRVSKEHHILQRGKAVTGDAARLFGQNFCEFHPRNPADLYCSDCKGVLCGTCVSDSHRSHTYTDISKMDENFRRQLEKVIEEMTGCLGEVQGRTQTLGKEKKKFAREVEDVRLKVVKRSEELKETLERHTKSLLDELASLQTIALVEFGKNMEDMERHLKTLETFKNYCEEMRSKGSPSDVCRSMVDLRKRTGELKDMHAVQVKKPICRLDVSFQPTKNQDYVNSYPNMVGVITGSATRARHKALITSNRPVVTSRLTMRLDNKRQKKMANRNVNGVACLEHRIYVLLTDAVSVFEDLEPFNCVTEVTIPRMKSLVDIAACHKYACLYVTDRERSCISRLGIDHVSSEVIQKISSPYTLSVSGDGNIVTVRWGKPSSVEIYRPDAQLLNNIILDPTVVLPYHAVQTSIRTIVLSHGGKDNRTHRVLELSLKGEILRSYPANNQLNGDLNCPVHLALDVQNRVFVADFYNGIVIMLRKDRELGWLLVVEPRDGVQRPSRLCYLADRKMLFLVNGNKSVDIYTLEETELEAGRSESVGTLARRPVTSPAAVELGHINPVMEMTRPNSLQQSETFTTSSRF